jgi:hypothetical protein
VDASIRANSPHREFGVIYVHRLRIEAGMTGGSVKKNSDARATPDEVFADAFRVARTGYSDVAWESLAPREKTQAIYREMRRLDRNRLAHSLRSATAGGSRTAEPPLQTMRG